MSRFWSWLRSTDVQTRDEINEHTRSADERLVSQDVESITDIEPPGETPRQTYVSSQDQRYPWAEVQPDQEPDHGLPEQEN